MLTIWLHLYTDRRNISSQKHFPDPFTGQLISPAPLCQQMGKLETYITPQIHFSPKVFCYIRWFLSHCLFTSTLNYSVSGGWIQRRMLCQCSLWEWRDDMPAEVWIYLYWEWSCSLSAGRTKDRLYLHSPAVRTPPQTQPALDGIRLNLPPYLHLVMKSRKDVSAIVKCFLRWAWKKSAALKENPAIVPWTVFRRKQYSLKDLNHNYNKKVSRLTSCN